MHRGAEGLQDRGYWRALYLILEAENEEKSGVGGRDAEEGGKIARCRVEERARSRPFLEARGVKTRGT